MFGSIIKKFQRKKLQDKRYAFLFEENQSDEVVVFDCETTGLDPKKDDIVSIGAVKIRENRIVTDEALHLYVRQTKQINPESIVIHQIRHCDLDHAVSIEEAIDTFLHYIGSRGLVGYYLEFDVAMINKYMKPMLGITLPNHKEEVSAIYYDKKIGRIPQRHIDLRFDAIIEDLGLPPLKGHDALNDAVMTAMIYLKLQHTYKLS